MNKLELELEVRKQLPQNIESVSERKKPRQTGDRVCIFTRQT
jgi:hypothetical protein